MPASVVKDSGDERHWRKAKELAAKQGRAGDYAYIMGIFQKMTGAKKSLTKSFTVAPAWRSERIPGQVPGQGGRNIERLLDMPAKKGGLAILDHTEPRLTPESVVKGLGFDLATENVWKGWLERNCASAPNEVVIRKALYERFIEDRTPPELRRALFQRAMMYYGGMRKSVVEIVTPDELLEKAEARGGSYHRRVAKKGGGYRYYYDPDKYDSREDAHMDGEGALRKRLQKMCVNHVTKAGEAGCNAQSFKALADRFGADKVAAALRASTAEGGPLEFASGYFRLKAKQLQKSRFIITR